MEEVEGSCELHRRQDLSRFGRNYKRPETIGRSSHSSAFASLQSTIAMLTCRRTQDGYIVPLKNHQRGLQQDISRNPLLHFMLNSSVASSSGMGTVWVQQRPNDKHHLIINKKRLPPSVRFSNGVPRVSAWYRLAADSTMPVFFLPPLIL